ncbi:MAG: peroxide stress protein YaaA [Bacillota bacterium]
MKIIISPAKKMNEVRDIIDTTKPLFLAEAEEIAKVVSGFSVEEIQKKMLCNAKLANLTKERYEKIKFNCSGSPAILAYEGLQYKYMSPKVFSEEQFKYVSEHLIILSGLYGGLRALDDVEPYRLEMQAKIAIGEYKNLYQFWGSKIYDTLLAAEEEVIDLASDEYSIAVRKYAKSTQQWIQVIFGEEICGKIIEKGAYVKMARGEMVDYMATINANTANDIKGFNRLGYKFSEKYSTKQKYTFIKEK